MLGVYSSSYFLFSAGRTVPSVRLVLFVRYYGTLHLQARRRFQRFTLPTTTADRNYRTVPAALRDPIAASWSATSVEKFSSLAALPSVQLCANAYFFRCFPRVVCTLAHLGKGLLRMSRNAFSNHSTRKPRTRLRCPGQ